MFNFLKYSYAYSQKLCFGQCYQMQVIKECNCSDSSFLSLYKSVRSANTSDEINCVFAVYQKFLSETMIKKFCLPLCKNFKTNSSFKLS